MDLWALHGTSQQLENTRSRHRTPEVCVCFFTHTYPNPFPSSLVLTNYVFIQAQDRLPL